jgi:lysophospholipase L1-like esterase
MDTDPGKREDRDLKAPAGTVLVVVVVALAFATLFNSAALVRAGEGMKQGPERSVILTLGKPIDDFAGFVGFHLPREGFDRAFGQESKTARNTELENGSLAILRGPTGASGASGTSGATGPAGVSTKLQLRRPTAARPLHLLVTGDSESGYLGEQLADLLPDGLVDVDVVPRDGTGLTNPNFFNWEVNAKQEIHDRSPDAVVIALGGNDGFNLDVGGVAQAPGTPEWQTEFARRAAVVMNALSQGGKRPVYWVPPPTARDPVYDKIYRSQNGAVKRAAAAIRGARFVDDYFAINHGHYSDTLVIDGKRVIARQSDGIHFSRDGALAPAKLVRRAMARDYPTLGPG